MAYAPAEIEEVLEQMRRVLLQWHREDTLGEIAIVRGGQELFVEERPRLRHARVKRESKRVGYAEKVT